MRKKDSINTDYNPFKEILCRIDGIDKRLSEIQSSLQILYNTVLGKFEKQEQNINAAQMIDSDRLDKKQAAKLLKVSTRTIERYIKNGTIPYLQHGGKVTFSYKELIDSKYNKKHRNTHKDFMSILISDKMPVE